MTNTHAMRVREMTLCCPTANFFAVSIMKTVELNVSRQQRQNGWALALPGSDLGGSWVVCDLKNLSIGKHRGLVFFSHATCPPRGQLFLCFMLSGTQAVRGLIWGCSYFMREKRAGQPEHPSPKPFCTEVVCVPSTRYIG